MKKGKHAHNQLDLARALIERHFTDGNERDREGYAIGVIRAETGARADKALVAAEELKTDLVRLKLYGVDSIIDRPQQITLELKALEHAVASFLEVVRLGEETRKADFEARREEAAR